jgi:uncharacterized protein YigA (DUF484 family)
MSKQPSSKSENVALSEQEVVAYLEKHPDLLQKHDALLERMQVPHKVGAGMISLIEHQVEVLREKNALQEDRLNVLINNAQVNEELTAKLHRYSLHLSSTRGLAELVQSASEDLRQLFDVDAVSIHIKPEYLADNVQISNISDKAYTAILDTMGTEPCSCHSELDDELMVAMFAEQASSLKSCALLALDAPHRIGLIALGSSDQSRFSPAMGTLILTRLGELFSAALMRNRAD